MSEMTVVIRVVGTVMVNVWSGPVIVEMMDSVVVIVTPGRVMVLVPSIGSVGVALSVVTEVVVLLLLLEVVSSPDVGSREIGLSWVWVWVWAWFVGVNERLFWNGFEYRLG